jgi:tripartite-type tricarboxylate transporter receptor subunit TctC
MRLPRRTLLHLAASAAALPTLSRIARAQTYPSRPVRIVVGFGAGSSPDLTARLMGEWLSQRFGQPFVVENRPGAGSNMGIQAVVRAPADGYTLLLVAASNTINVSLYDKADFNLLRDIAPVARIGNTPQVMEVTPSFSAKTVPEFIAYAKANPGKINMASGGVGNLSHVSGELFKMMAGVDMLHVPYRSVAPALTDLLSGQVQVMFDAMPSSIASIKAGKLRALAVTTPTRSEALPDVPTVGDFVPGFETSGWSGIGVPKNTPVEIVERLNKEINAGLADPRIMARLADQGSEVRAGTPSDFGKFISEDAEKWAKVIKFAGIKPD